jgi:hypothetical protein
MNIVKLIILLIFTNQIFGQAADTSKINNSRIELEKDSSLRNQENYFNSFPNSFDEFDATFGYKGNSPAPLYNNSFGYIKLFFNLDSIPIRTQMKKWTEMSIGGNWDADAISYFQMFLRLGVSKNVILTHNVLKDKSKNDIESFFYFYFSSIHFQYDSIPRYFDAIKNNDKQFYNFLKNGYNRALKDSGH